MLQLLLDEHLSPKIAFGLGNRVKSLKVTSILEWEAGNYLGESDEVILRAAFDQQKTLVTYDLSTIAPLIKSWTEQGIKHGGVIFIDEKTPRTNDFGALIEGLAKLYKRELANSWENRVAYLSK